MSSELHVYEDEYHFLVKCPLYIYADERKQFNVSLPSNHLSCNYEITIFKLVEFIAKALKMKSYVNHVMPRLWLLNI